MEAEQKFEQAIDYYERALDINPSQTDIRNWYSSALDIVGREMDALAEMEKAYELDPLSVLTLNNYTNELVGRRQFDQVSSVLERLTQVDPARGASFRGFILEEQHRAADGAVELFRGADLDPASLRVRGQAAFTLLNFGLEEDALQVWPYPDILPIVSSTGDDEYALELAQGKFEEDPTDPGNVESLAWAYWQVGNNEQAMKNARRYLDTLDDSRRSIDGANWMLVIDAWQRGDEETLLRYLEPMERDSDRSRESGVDSTGIHFGKALMLFMRGEIQTSLDHLDIAFSRGVISSSLLDRTYTRLGLSDMPPYVERRKAYEEYLRGERQKFLAVACGPDGFSTWQPSPAVCAEVEAI